MSRGKRQGPSRAQPALPPEPDPLTVKGVRAEWIVLGGAFLLAVLAYARVLDGEFQLDDFQTVVANPAVKDLGGLLANFLDSLLHAGRPVTDLTFALDWRLGGLETFGYHLVNLALHLGNVALVFLFTRSVLSLAGTARPPLAAAVVAALFAVHPVQTQAVTYVTQRAELLASGLYLATLLLVLAAERRGRTPVGVLAYGAALLLFVAGFGAKATLVTMPAAWLALAAIVPSTQARASLAPWPRRLALVAPFLLLDLYLSTRTVQSFGNSIHVGFAIQGIPPWTYFITQWQVLVTYLQLLAVPVGQGLDRFFPPSPGLADPATLGALAVLLALAALAGWLLARSRRRDDAAGAAGRAAAFGILWFFLVLAPTSSVVPLADLIEEHRVYLAAWGILTAATLLGGWLLARLPPGRRTAAGGLAIGLVLCLLAALAWSRNGVWTTRLGLWSAEVAARPQNYRARTNLAQAYEERGMIQEALGQYLEALRLGGSNPRNEWILRNNVAAMLMNLGRLQEAQAHLERALQLQPDDADALVNLARVRLALGDAAGAESLAQRALRANPAHGPSMNVMGKLRMMAGDPAGALEWFQRAVRVNPDETSAWLNLGQVLRATGRPAEACQMWRRAASSPMPSRYRDDAARLLAAERCGR